MAANWVSCLGVSKAPYFVHMTSPSLVPMMVPSWDHYLVKMAAHCVDLVLAPSLIICLGQMTTHCLDPMMVPSWNHYLVPMTAH